MWDEYILVSIYIEILIQPCISKKYLNKKYENINGDRLRSVIRFILKQKKLFSRNLYILGSFNTNIIMLVATNS